MGQQTSRKSNGIYFHHKIPSFLFIKKQDTTHKPEEPIKFQYKLTKKSNERHKNKANNFDGFGFNPITNLKNVLDGVKSDCSGLKKCAVSESKHDNISEAYKLRTVEKSTNSGQILGIETASSNNTRLLRLKTDNLISTGKISQSDVKKPKRRSKDTKKDIRTKHLPIRTKSEPNLRSERGKDRNRCKRNYGNTSHRVEKVQQFGYEIQDVDEFLAKVSNYIYYY